MRGDKAEEMMAELSFQRKRAATPLRKLLQSAIANAENNMGLERSTLIIKEIRVDGGPILYRSRPRARGTAFPIRKRTSHVYLILEGNKMDKKKKEEIKNKKTETGEEQGQRTSSKKIVSKKRGAAKRPKKEMPGGTKKEARKGLRGLGSKLFRRKSI